jgi:hypothetical protein
VPPRISGGEAEEGLQRAVAAPGAAMLYSNFGYQLLIAALAAGDVGAGYPCRGARLGAAGA